MAKMLAEVGDQELRDELNRRFVAYSHSLCNYCHQPAGSEPVCAHPFRHRGEWQATGTDKLVALLAFRPDLLQEVLVRLKVPLLNCEGHDHDCEGKVFFPTGAMTMYSWDGQGEDPNRDRMLCPGCSENYVSDWQAQWDEYNSCRI